eukprot:m.15133 g.15133  ORF g.15133 m.15133 type:complete len:744 (-) comp4966_c0_seq1:193-2424(-)
MMMGRIGVVLAVLAALAHGRSVEDNRLDKHIKHYEPLDLAHEVLFHNADTRQMHAGTFDLPVSVFDQDHVFTLSPATNLLAPGAKCTVVDDDGSYEVPLDDVTYYHGHAVGHNESFVHVSIRRSGHMQALVILDKTNSFQIAPAHKHFEEPQEFGHVAYRTTDYDWKPTGSMVDYVKHATPTFAQSESTNDDSTEAHARSRRAIYVEGRTSCKVALVADKTFWEVVGGAPGASNADALTIDAMLESFNFASNVFAKTDFSSLSATKPQIQLQVASIEIVKSASEDINQAAAQVDGETFLTTFSKTDWSSYCLAHLYTAVDFSGGLLGLAWVGSPSVSTPGGVCQGRTGSLSDPSYTNTGFTTAVNDGNRVATVMESIVTTHEFGHNFGSDHDARTPIPSGGVYVMYPSAADGDDSNNYLFSAASITSISDVVAAKGGCMETYDAQVCGNGVAEKPEECDCGSASTCNTQDACCNVYDPDDLLLTNCKIKSSAACSPFNPQDGACCDGDTCTFLASGTLCREATECTAEVTCSAAGECPNATNLDSNTPCLSDSTLCDGDGRCVKSVCELFTGWETPCTVVFGETTAPCKNYCCQGTDCHLTANCKIVTDATVAAAFDSSRLPAGYTNMTAADFEDKAPNLKCQFTDGEPNSGYCDTGLICRDVEGEDTYLNKLNDLAADLWNNENVQAALTWLKEDGPLGLKNWQWVLVGGIALLTILTITGSCFTKPRRTRRVAGGKRPGAV